MYKIYIFFCFLSVFTFSQSTKEIDESLEVSSVLIKNGKRKEALELLDKNINYAIETQYTKGLINSYQRKSSYLYYDRDFSGSIQYAKLALNQDLSKITYQQQCDLYHILGQNYVVLNLNEDAIKNYKKMIQIAEMIPDKNISIFKKSVANNDLATIYWRNKKNIDSAYYYMHKVYRDLNILNNRNVNQNTLLTKATTGVAMIHSLKGRKDSSEYYFSKAAQYIPKDATGINKDNNLAHHLSYIYLANNRRDEAKKVNSLFVKNAEKAQNLVELHKAYDIRYRISEKNKDTAEAYKSLKDFVKIDDSLKGIDQDAIKTSYENVISEKSKRIDDDSKKSNYFIAFIVFILVVLAIIIFYFIKFKKLKKIEKKNLLQEKEKEIFSLESKINVAFEEVVKLAEENSPNFLARFKEVYPEFIEKILNIYPEIHNSDLTYCAYVKLNFSTKDISKHTFVTLKTVQMRRYRLRKKLNISSEQDFDVWIKNL